MTALYRKTEAPELWWAELSSLLRSYNYLNGDREFDGWEKLFYAEPMRLLTIDAVCAAGMPSPPVLTLADFQDGTYVDICWQYAYAQIVYIQCQETPP